MLDNIKRMDKECFMRLLDRFCHDDEHGHRCMSPDDLKRFKECLDELERIEREAWEQHFQNPLKREWVVEQETTNQ